MSLQCQNFHENLSNLVMKIPKLLCPPPVSSPVSSVPLLQASPSLILSRGILSLSLTLSFSSPKTPWCSFSTAFFELLLPNFFNSEQNSVIWFRISRPANKLRAEKVLLSCGFFSCSDGFPNCFFISVNFLDLVLPLGMGAETFGFLFSLSEMEFFEKYDPLVLKDFGLGIFAAEDEFISFSFCFKSLHQK